MVFLYQILVFEQGFVSLGRVPLLFSAVSYEGIDLRLQELVGYLFVILYQKDI
jgi:hypothetical protein